MHSHVGRPLAPSPHRPALPPAFKSLPASSGPPYPQDTFFSMIPHWPWIQIRKIPQAVKHIIFRPQVADVWRAVSSSLTVEYLSPLLVALLRTSGFLRNTNLLKIISWANVSYPLKTIPQTAA
ncbi:hypothetical protein C8J57DRAFT_1523329 [Mycena rebaudengoi]|nr:hypothetical protein C8J57DRAFT_1523329 [Mycena rebaudengoi]